MSEVVKKRHDNLESFKHEVCRENVVNGGDVVYMIVMHD